MYAQPGQMTVAMRAMPRVDGPRVLRIGMVQGGRVVEERVMKQRAHVTIGASPKATFFAGNAPEIVRLFEATQTGYALHLREGMRGRIALVSGVTEVAGPQRIDLDEHARGKIVAEGITFLFQFVEPAPLSPKPQLPLAVDGGLGSRIDWGFAVIAAFSFLLHFGFAGAVNSDWFDPTLDDDAETASLIEQAKDRPSPPVMEEQKTEVTPEKNDEVVDKPSPTPGPPGPKAPVSPGPAHPVSNDPVALTHELEQLELKALGSIGAGGPVQSSLLKPGAATADSNLDEIAKKKGGVDTEGNLKVGAGDGGPIGPGQDGKNTLAGGFNSTKSGTPTNAGNDNSIAVKAPTTIATPPTQGSSNVKDVDSVIARNRWRFKTCYDRVLAKDPTAGGTVRVTVGIGEGGEVTSANATSSDAPSELTQCIGTAFSAMKFAAPDGGSAKFVAPVVLSTAKK